MANNLVERIDLAFINEDGTIEIIDSGSICHEYPFNFQYKLYLPFADNQTAILKTLYQNPPKHFSYTQRFFKYLENRSLLYYEVSKKYFPIIKGILDSDFSEATKKLLIQKIDLELNKIYPYKNPD